MTEYIEREAIKELLERYGATDDALALIDSVPVADVAPVRHGRWIFDHMTGEWSYYSRCSECGHKEFFANDSVERSHRYCCSCGALMDENVNNHEVSGS